MVHHKRMSLFFSIFQDTIKFILYMNDGFFDIDYTSLTIFKFAFHQPILF